MSTPEPPPNLSARLNTLAQRLGLSGRGTRLLRERAAALRLPFQPLPAIQSSIWWQAGPPLQRLVKLPRSALSGPVQDDKADAHALLVGVVAQERQQLDNFDLRLIDGLDHAGATDHHISLEQFCATPACRNVRIISYKDFVKTISQALPRYLAGERIHLRAASWLGQRWFWAGERQIEALAGAIVYARRRGLEISLPADITRYRLSASGLDALQARYHVLAMPVQAWSAPDFMSLLLDNGLPYARLSLLHTPGAPEILLLPRQNAEAMALGEGLSRAGAADVVAYLRGLMQTTDS
ncbi:hypothetical protein D3880_14445 [Pseudomonas cavernae]|uniref:Uncharacterized protein n=2 Tax=Pseudomonas cavernae TaxID=2320867 RepID=A0A385Z426_9PSED|nr:DUF6685 family protein [Pseudomonas cavernae]AYC33484.1 hypothetical protein D3880_14445 [Pseudomonas cavernae]